MNLRAVTSLSILNKQFLKIQIDNEGNEMFSGITSMLI